MTLAESAYASQVREFVRAFHGRITPRVVTGTTWVRVTPPDQDDLNHVRKVPSFMPFTRVGSLGEVWDVTGDYVTVRVGRDSIMFHRDTFLETFVRAVAGKEWLTPTTYGSQ